MLNPELIDPIIRAALREDIGRKDITTSAVIPKNLAIKADIEFKERGVLCGLDITEQVFRIVDSNLRFLPVAKDGEPIEAGREVAYMEGLAASILVGERTALNLLSHLSGIATKTREYVDKVKGTQVRILDTRKTTPGLRVLEKYAVKTGGGQNHRLGLYDQVLIKDNHLRILRKEALIDIVALARRSVQKKTVIGVEVINIMEAAEALKSKADYILLDNMPVEEVRECVALRKSIGSKIEFEVSGGVTLDNVQPYAQTGVERISVGALTHSFKATDVSLNIVG